VYSGRGFSQDVNSRRGASPIDAFLLRRLGGCLIREAGGLQRAALGAWRRIRRAVTNQCSPRAADSFVAAGAVAVSRPPGKAGEPRRLTFVALFGSPLPADSVDRRSAGLQLCFTGATTVAGAALACSKIADFHIFFGRFGWLVWRIAFSPARKPGFEFHGFSHPNVFILGGANFLREKKRASVSGPASRLRLHRLWFRRRNFWLSPSERWGGGVAQPGFPVTGCISSVTRKCNAVCIRSGRAEEAWTRNRESQIVRRRSGQCGPNVAWNQVAGQGVLRSVWCRWLSSTPSGSPERRRLARNDAIVVLRGGSAIMVVIRVPPRENSGRGTRAV